MADNGFARFITDFRTILTIMVILGGFAVRAELHMGDKTEYVPKTEIEIHLENLRGDHTRMEREIRELRKALVNRANLP